MGKGAFLPQAKTLTAFQLKTRNHKQDRGIIRKANITRSREHLPKLEVDGEIPARFELGYRRLSEEPLPDPAALRVAPYRRQAFQETHAQEVVGVLGRYHPRGEYGR